MTTILTLREQQYIQTHYKIESAHSMARRFGVSTGVVSKLIRYWRLEITPEDRFNIRSNGMSTATQKEDNYIRKHYLTMPVKRMAANLGRSQLFVRTRLEVLELVIPAELIENRKKQARFKPGHTPANKGKKMSRDQYKRVSHTMFNPGHTPVNTLYNKAIRPRTNSRTDRTYRFIRLKRGKWVELHRYVYERIFGRIPSTHVCAFMDGNTLNCDPENLILITKAENAERNRLTQYPPEVQEVIKLNNKLKKAIHAKKQN